jgi:hypothetical protein
VGTRFRYFRHTILLIGAVAIACASAPAAGAEHIEGGDHAGVVSGSAFVKIREVHPKPRKQCVGLGLTILGWRMYPKEIGEEKLRPNGGHYRVYVDGRFRTNGKNPRYVNVCRLSRGDTHRLRVVLAYNDGTELAARSQVVTVELR